MGTFDRLMKLVSDSIKMQVRVSDLGEHAKELAREMREFDKRLVRIETYMEIADKVRKIPNNTE